MPDVLISRAAAQVEATAQDEGAKKTRRSSKRKVGLSEVNEQIAQDPQIRSLAHEWLDTHVSEMVKTLDCDGASICMVM